MDACTAAETASTMLKIAAAEQQEAQALHVCGLPSPTLTDDYASTEADVSSFAWAARSWCTCVEAWLSS